MEAVLRPRNLVLVRAGDASQHPLWLGGQRDFDVVVQYYGTQPGRFADGADHYHHDQVNDLRTFSALRRLLLENPNYLSDYDCFFFPDDDIATDASTISALFALHRELGLGISQPALSEDSYFSHPMMLAHPGIALRQVNFVEVMCPMFSKRALLRCLPTFDQSITSWGLDWVWQTLLPAAGERAAIIDCLPVRHTRPVGGGDNYLGLDESPFEEGRRVCADHGVHLGQRMRVEKAWDAQFQPIATMSLAQELLKRMPRPTAQRLNPGDGYVDALRWQARLVRERRRNPVPVRDPAAESRRQMILRASCDAVGLRVSPSGWLPEELELTRAAHVADSNGVGWVLEPSRGCDPGPHADPLVGRLLGALVQERVSSTAPVSIAFAADDPEVLDAVQLSVGRPVRVVVCVDVGDEVSPVVDRLLNHLDRVGLSGDDVDVELREHAPDPGQELGVDLARRWPRAPWKPGLPLPVDPLGLADVLQVIDAVARASQVPQGLVTASAD